jgi:NADH-quinone oxidoreductase subunit N
MDQLTTDLLSIGPLLSLVVVALLVLLFESLVKKSEPVSYWTSVAGLLVSIGVAVPGISSHGTAFHGMLRAGGYANFFSILFFISALLTIVFARDYLRKRNSEFGEFYLLILFATMGMVLMAAATDLIIVFLGIELMSICLYVLAGFVRASVLSNESSLKYFLLGAFATGFLLYGIALLYGSTGTTSISAITDHFELYSSSLLFLTGIALLIVGLSFKIGAVPFHMWVPDVYQGSPSPVSGFMATGAKAAGFSIFVGMFAFRYAHGAQIGTLLAILAAASMILGNVVAIAQTNVKRMLAYSSVAHAGYMLTGLAAGNQYGRDGILFYILSYAFMNLGAFGLISFMEREGEKHLTFDDYAGLGTTRPFLAALMSVFMFSLAGIPPFAGFIGKYYLFLGAVEGGFTWLAIVGVLASVVSVYYYLRLVMVMYFKDSLGGETVSFSAPSAALLLISALILLGLGVFPSSLLSIITTLY